MALGIGDAASAGIVRAWNASDTPDVTGDQFEAAVAGLKRSIHDGGAATSRAIALELLDIIVNPEGS